MVPFGRRRFLLTAAGGLVPLLTSAQWAHALTGRPALAGGWSGDPRVKPPFGAAEVDWGHPLARSLINLFPLNEGGGPFQDLVVPRSVSLGTAGAWATSPRGQAFLYPGTSSATGLTLRWPALQTQLSIEMVMVWGAYANDNDLLVEHTTNYNSKNGLLINPNASSPPGVFFVGLSRNNGAYNAGRFGRTVLPAGTWAHAVFTFDRTTGTALGTGAFINGVAASMTQSATGDMGSTPFESGDTFLFSRGGTTLLGAGSLAKFAVYGTVLSAREARALHAEPYAMLRPRTIAFWGKPATVTVGPSRRMLFGVGR